MSPGRTPQVSVVIPTHDRWPLVGEAIASVLRQTFADLEVIVVDDGSSDGTAERVRLITDGRVRYLPIDRTGVIGRVRNQGVAQARGRWVAFLDSDDLWDPRKLELQLDALSRTGAR